jgi:cytochrome c oxidase subunit 2
MVTHFWFTPTQVGKYEVLCAEYCGVGHYNMRGHMIVEEPVAFQQWLSGQPTFAETLATAVKPGRDALLDQGRLLAENSGCTACHSLDGSASLGPGWQGLFGRTEQLADGSSVQVDEAYLKESILEPQARLVQGYPPVMVPYTFNQNELDALVALIKSLSSQAPGDEPGASGQGGDLVEQGRLLAESHGCLACHSVDGSPSVGPGWQGLYGKTEVLADGSQVVVDERYLKVSVLEPNAQVVKGYAAMMPPFALSDEELEALIAFIKSKASANPDAALPKPGGLQ